MAKIINIPSVTGNIVITATASLINSEDGMIANMTYGKGVELSTGVIKDESSSWATVNPITVTQGQAYQISLDATWAWVIAYDDSDNFVSQIVQGDANNPQTFTFTASTGKIRYGCYDPSKQLTYCNLTETTAVSYTVTNSLTNCTNSNTTTTIVSGNSYSATISANSGYTLGSITVTMGGTDITSSAVSGSSVNISSVTGNIVISCTATSSSSGGSGSLTGTYLFFGDSICAGGGSGGYGYPEAVKAVETGMTATNYAVSGTCIAKNDSYDVSYPSILSRIQGSTPYADYVVLEGGFNDSWGYRNPIGTFKGGTAPTDASSISSYASSLNEYQFADALEKCICEIKLKYWEKKIFYVIPHNVDAAVYANEYYTVAIQVCNKWGVILIDLRNCGMPSYQDGTYNVDGTHPSAAGYDKYYAPNIISVLKANL